jgi:hypothetical protein
VYRPETWERAGVRDYIESKILFCSVAQALTLTLSQREREPNLITLMTDLEI